MWLLPIGIFVTLSLLLIPHMSSTTTKSFSYSTFVSEVTSGDVRTASVNPTGAITGVLKGGDDYTSQIPTAITDTELAPTLKAHGVDLTGVGQGSALLADLLSFLPLLLFVAFFIWSGRRGARRQTLSPHADFRLPAIPRKSHGLGVFAVKCDVPG